MSKFIKSLFASKPKSIFRDQLLVTLSEKFTQQKAGHPFIDESALRITIEYDVHYGCVHAVTSIEVYDYAWDKYTDITQIAMGQFQFHFAELVENINWNRIYDQGHSVGKEEVKRYA